MAQTSNTRRLTTYDEKLPSKPLLQILMGIRWATIALAVILFILAVRQWIERGGSNEARYAANSWYYDYEPQTSHLEWYHWLFVLVIGIIIIGVSSSYHYTNYEYVGQGKIISGGTNSGGIFSLSWGFWVEGNTRANELRRTWHYVDALTFREYNRGDYIDFNS